MGLDRRGGGAIQGHTGGELGGRGSLFLSLLALGKKGREPEQSREVQTNRGEMDGGGGTGARALLIGRLRISLCGWIDLARVELHHLPCISLFFSQPGEVHSLRRAQYFLDYCNTKGYKITNSDEVSYLQLHGYTLLRCNTQ